MSSSPNISLQQIMEVITEKEFNAFSMSYANCHPEMVEALAKRYKKKLFGEEKIDCQSEVLACYKYLKTSRGNYYNRGWEPHETDWDYVHCHLIKLIKRATIWAKGSHPKEAIEVGLRILNETAERYADEFIADQYDFDYADMCLDETDELLRTALRNTAITKEEKLNVADRLETILKMEAFDYDIDEGASSIMEQIRQENLSDDEQLAIMWRQANECKTIYIKGRKLREIWDFLLALNRTDEAIAVYKKYPDYGDLRERYGSLLEQQNLLDDALKLYKEKSNNRVDRVRWTKCCLRIYKRQGDNCNIIESLKQLFLDDHDEFEYYQQLKSLIPVGQWEGIRDKLINRRFRKDDLTDSLGKILVSEGLQKQLFERICSQHYNLLGETEKYKKRLSIGHIDTIVEILRQRYSRPFGVLTRKAYQEKVEELNRIAKLSTAGKVVVKELVEQYRNQYHNRPALLEELKKVKV